MLTIYGKACAIILVLFLSFATSWAMDFSQWSTEELYELRGAITGASQGEKDAYFKEWQERVKVMNDAEKAKYLQKEETPAGDGQAVGNGENKTPVMQSRGYDDQGTGTVIFGGGPKR